MPVALLGLVSLAPVLALCALAVKLSSRGSVIYRQKRVGQFGEPFELLKLRTMHVHESGPQVTASGDKRISRVVRWLRLLKLDEFPELWNVFRGEMSLVGPRPEVPYYVDLEDPMWRTVLQVRPGLTDPVTLRLRDEEGLLAKVSDDAESFYLNTLQPYKLAGYAEYLRCRTWWSDIKVIFLTAWRVVFPGSVDQPTLDEVSQVAPASKGVAPDQ